MITDTRDRIQTYIAEHGQVSVAQLVREFGYSPQMIHRHVKRLLTEGDIEKLGSSPRVFYQAKKDIKQTHEVQQHISRVDSDSIIEKTFYTITPAGRVLEGDEAFSRWCQDRSLDTDAQAKQYIKTWTEYQSYKNSQKLIDATAKAQQTFASEMSLDKLYYSEFSAYEVFGKTKMYTQLLYSKLNQDKKLIHTLVKEHRIKDITETILKNHSIDAVGFIPSTIPRKVQFQKELQFQLNLAKPIIEINKISRGVLVAQKTLNKTKDRIENSKETFVVPQQGLPYQNILLIDDFVGSGATLNYVAQKIRMRSANNTPLIVGYALCGTPNGVVNTSKKFEVVREI